MLKKLLWVMMLAVCAVPALADFVFVGEPIEVWPDVFENDTYFPATAANVSVLYPNGSYFIRNASASLIQTGLFRLNFTPLDPGVYYAYATFYQGSNALGVASQTFTVQERVIDMDMFSSILLLLVGIVLLAIAKYVEQPAYYGIATAWFFSLAVYGGLVIFRGVELFSQTGLMTLLLMLLGFISLFHWYWETD